MCPSRTFEASRSLVLERTIDQEELMACHRSVRSLVWAMELRASFELFKVFEGWTVACSAEGRASVRATYSAEGQGFGEFFLSQWIIVLRVLEGLGEHRRDDSGAHCVSRPGRIRYGID